MINKIKCLFLGHKKYSPQCLNEHDVIAIKDILGGILVRINVCERCGAVYTDLKGN